METDESTDKKGKAREVLMDIGLEAKEGSSLIAQILGFKFAYYQVRLLSTLSNYFLLTRTTQIET